MPLAENLARIREQIANASHRVSRPDSEVTLMAVSKMHPPEAILEAYAAGLRLFGENRVQEWQEKSTSLAELTGAKLTIASVGPNRDQTIVL